MRSKWGGVEAADSFPRITWKSSLTVGSKDVDGNELGGTEIRSLVAFDGKLFAGNGYWTDIETKNEALPGAQVFVLDRPVSEGGRWKQDLQLVQRTQVTKQRRYFTISALQSVTFKTDGAGTRLKRPVDLLLASVWDRYPGVDIFVRGTGKSEWAKSTLAKAVAGQSHRHVRSFFLYRDSVTKIDMLFAGVSGNKGQPTRIVPGVYDPRAPGRIRWLAAESFKDTPGPGDRVTSFVEANGKLYATVCGKLYERVNGASPEWRMIYQSPNDYAPVDKPGENGYRGATVVPGKNGDHILMAMEGREPEIRRVDPVTRKNKQELDLRVFLKKELKRQDMKYVIPSYNDTAAITLPGGKTAHFFGIEAFVGKAPNTWRMGLEKDAWYIVRLDATNYVARRVKDDAKPHPTPMIATRSIIASPFPSELGKVLYAAGYDANHIEGVHHDTGWIYRGEFGGK